MNSQITLTSKEVCQKFRINKYTLLNWRRGFYFVRKKGKVFYFTDESLLDSEWDDEKRMLRYNPVKIAVWINKLKRKGELR